MICCNFYVLPWVSCPPRTRLYHWPPRHAASVSSKFARSPNQPKVHPSHFKDCYLSHNTTSEKEDFSLQPIFKIGKLCKDITLLAFFFFIYYYLNSWEQRMKIEITIVLLGSRGRSLGTKEYCDWVCFHLNSVYSDFSSF